MAQQGLFRKKQNAPTAPDGELIQAIRRSRMLEERYANLEKRMQVVEENLIEHNRKLSAELRLISEDLKEAKTNIADLTERFQLLLKELEEFARREDVESVRKYLDYWDPLKFVTQNQVEKIVREILEETKQVDG